MSKAGTPGAVLVPIGFVSDHLEVLYDLDVEAAGAAAEVGLAFGRTEVVNAEPSVMAALADLIVTSLPEYRHKTARYARKAKAKANRRR